MCFIILIDTDGIVDGLNSMKWEWNTSSIWDVSAMVFWKGNVRHHHGDTCLRVILKDEQVHFELIFLDHV